MKIYRPVKNKYITQKYGLKNTAEHLLPLYKSLGLLGHDGFDHALNCKDHQAKRGGQCENVYFNIDGYATITAIYKDETTGFGIIAQDQDLNFKHVWWHFDLINPALKLGDRLEAGTLLGVGGNTGYSTGAHLHYGLYDYTQYNNGYHGAIDPEPYYVNIYILDKMKSIEEQVSIYQRMINLFPQFKDLYQGAIDYVKKMIKR